MLDAELEVCERIGIRHGLFLDWPPDDQAKAIGRLFAERQRAAETCPDCGTKPDDWLDENKRKLIPAPFTAEYENCEGCSTRGRARDELDRRREYQKIDPGMKVRLRPNPEASD